MFEMDDDAFLPKDKKEFFCMRDTEDGTFYFVIDSRENVEYLCEKINDYIHEINYLDERLEESFQKNKMLNRDLKFIRERKDYLESEWDRFDRISKETIDDLEKRYEFGQTEYQGCPMHNIRFGINSLKKIRKELGFDEEI